MATKTDLASVIQDPVRFSRGILGHDPWWMAEDIMRSVLANPRTAVKSCHASSKTFTAATIVAWWVIRYTDGIVVTTAPTDTQVKELLWKEIGLNVQAIRDVFRGIPEANQKSWRLSPGRSAIGFSTNQGVRFQGFHGDHVLIVLDEAAGVRADIFPAIEGIRAGGNVHVLAIGNPSSPSGPFYDAFAANRALWHTFTINAFFTPNFVDETRPGREFITLEDLIEMRNSDRLQHAPRNYLTLRSWVLEKYDEWGEGSPLWDTKVLGAFPAEGADQLLGLAYLEAAERLPIESQPDDPLEAGIDVAGPGEDETTLWVRRGPCVEFVKGWAQSDPRGAVLDALRPWEDELQARGLVKVDSVGMGYYFAKHIQDQGYGDRVRFVNVGTETRMPEKYLNLKAELYWGLRMRVRQGQFSFLRALARDDVSQSTIHKAMSQLASIKYKHNERGQIAIEKKEDAVKRGVKSPDYAEGCMLAFAADTAPGMVQFMEMLAVREWERAEAAEDDDDD